MRSKNPEKMKEICTYVRDYYRIKRSSPSVSEIAKGVGIAKTTAYRYLVDMNERGMISIPRFLIVDKEGKIVVSNATSPDQPEELMKQLRQVLAE